MTALPASAPGAHVSALTRLRALRWGLLIAALGLFALHAWVYRFFTVDDAFISLRFVRQWLAGNGLVFNIGERVEGYSNFLWIVLLAPLGRAGFDLNLAARTVGALLGAATLLLTWRLSLANGWSGLAALLLAVSAPFAAWSVSGLETPLVAALVMLSATVYLREASEGRGYWSGLWFGLLALARPDGLLFAGAAGLLRIADLGHARMRLTRQDWTRLAIFAVIVGAHFTWRWLYYGDLLPNTIYAKSMGGQARGLAEGIYYVYLGLIQIGGPALLALTAAAVLTQRPLPPVLRYSLATAAAYFLFMVAAGGDWMPLNRFFVHVLPLLYLIIEGGLHGLSDAWAANRGRWLFGATALVLVGFLLFSSAEARFVTTAERHEPVNIMAPVADYLAGQGLGAGDAVAVVEMGYLGYKLPLEVRFIDVVGLTDRHIAHLPPQFPGGLSGRGDLFGKWDPGYVLAQSPRYIQMWLTGRNADGTWQSHFTGTTLIARHPEFLAHYRLVAAPGINDLYRLKVDSAISGLFERIE
jgi:hypothetical protein